MYELYTSAWVGMPMWMYKIALPRVNDEAYTRFFH